MPNIGYTKRLIMNNTEKLRAAGLEVTEYTAEDRDRLRKKATFKYKKSCQRMKRYRRRGRRNRYLKVRYTAIKTERSGLV